MDKNILDFIVNIAWPVVTLIGIIILGPGGVLKEVIGEFAKNALDISNAVNKFNDTAFDLKETQKHLKDSTDWVSGLERKINDINSKIENLSQTTENLSNTTDQLAILDFNRESAVQISKTADVLMSNKSVDEMYADINQKWSELTTKLENRIGGQFDARSIGQMAWKLVDRRRAQPIEAVQAELFGRLHSQMKRFIRLQRTKDEWLTHDVYTSFINLVDEASASIS